MSMYPDQVRSRPLDYSSEREFPLFKFFNQVYAWMCVGLAVTGLVAFVGSQTPAIWPILASKGVMVAAALGLFALSMATQTVAMKVSAGAGLAMFLLYATVLGVLLSGIFVIYPAATIFGAFMITAGGFGAVSLVGFIIKKDLGTIGRMAVMMAFGLFAASIFNIFFASTALSWFITYAVLIVFAVITAYQTQKLKEMALAEAHNPQFLQRLAVVGSLTLYVAFINMFLSVLQILGGNRK